MVIHDIPVYVPTVMSGTSAVDLFSEWAKLNRDEGMERGHSASVDAIIAAVKGRLPSEFTAIDLGCGNGWAVRRLMRMPGGIFS